MIELIPHPHFAERATSFYEGYELIDIILNGDARYSRKTLKPASERICRFCGKTYPVTKFSNWSHLLPQLIGNRNLYSDFECDKCNERFSVVENDLAEFLGVSRSFTGLNDERMAPGFKGKKLHAKSRSFYGNNILIIAPEDVEHVEGRTKIRYVKNGFAPSNVYKALLKSALSLLDENTVKENYERALGYLAGQTVIKSGAFITGYKLSFGLNVPLHICIFQKKQQNEKTHTHIVSFNFQNTMISLPVPLHKNDFPTRSQEINCLIPPPYFTNDRVISIATPVSFIRDLSSTIKVEDEEEHITIVVDPNDLNLRHSYNPVTGEMKLQERGPDNVRYLIVTRDGASFDPKELSAFIEAQTSQK